MVANDFLTRTLLKGMTDLAVALRKRGGEKALALASRIETCLETALRVGEEFGPKFGDGHPFMHFNRMFRFTPELAGSFVTIYVLNRNCEELEEMLKRDADLADLVPLLHPPLQPNHTKPTDELVAN